MDTEKDKKRLKQIALQKKKDRVPLEIEELAAYLGVSTRHIERLYKKIDDPNKLKATYYGGVVRITWENLEEYDRTHSQASLLSLSHFTDEDLDELDPAAGTGTKPNYP